jgi:hypothetical protein
MPTKLAPAAADVEEKALQYFALKDALAKALKAAADAQIPLDVLKSELIEMVSEFGSAHAEKSKILHGLSNEIMVTFGQSVSIDAAAVERFRLQLAEDGQSRLSKKIFQATTRWSLAPNSSEVIKGSKLSKTLLALYSQCEVIKSRAPSLVVRSA